eukprot:c1181_g1_i2.p1 GENE.c1181_g1_i2~~c1181_g1_i2.p1  ORF type:complete len:116 (-),score=12.76 c1181_g1_i2:534-881(-)
MNTCSARWSTETTDRTARAFIGRQQPDNMEEVDQEQWDEERQAFVMRKVFVKKDGRAYHDNKLQGANKNSFHERSPRCNSCHIYGSKEHFVARCPFKESVTELIPALKFKTPKRA